MYPPRNVSVSITGSPEIVEECFLQDLQHSLSDTSDDEASPRGTSKAPFLASSNWSTRQSLFSERWRAERHRLVNTAAAQENVATRICQQCGSNPAAVRCCDCRPRPFFCAECDVSMHTRHVLHNRDAMTAGFYQPLPPTAGFYQPLPPTTFVVDKALSHCGRYDLSMPELSCEACQATWAAGVVDLNRRRTDMLTLMVMRWNQQKFNNLATALTRRYQKTTKALQSQLQNLESMKVELAVTESQLEDWVNDVKDWADATITTTNDVDALANRIEVLVASVKRRSQRLYKDTDGNKGRARIRRKIREEKGILTSLVETYNRMVPNTETLCLETILSGETAWPWQLPHSDSVDLRTKRKAFDIIMSVRRLQEEQKILVAEMDHHWKYLSTRAETLRELSCLFASETLQSSLCGLSEEGLKGLQSIIHKKQRKISDMRVQARDCYLQVLSGAENTNLLNKSSADDYDSDFEISDDEL
ncbi:ATP-binding cassette sub-family D member 3 [Labeo rohita]|uniref:ATP-binding cassette sub-family D member 3 n=1 Tax=Labeo rohita TaxID=84645 RepID=A0A498NVU1_LABRO|nr:ATP-binding cassette sub-family D member 3 [Labeo rohita]